MRKAKQISSDSRETVISRALTPEARENEIISLAMDEAERQIREGCASSQVITHFLRQGTVKAQMELEKLRHETALLEAKTEALQSSKRMEELYSQAIKAMQRYNGKSDDNEEEL